MDATPYNDTQGFVASVTEHQGQEITAVTIRTTQPTTAEEVAIGLALRITEEHIRFSQIEACRNYLAGRISHKALPMLRQNLSVLVHIVWTPDHIRLEVNQAGHAAAREHILRAVGDCPIVASYPSPYHRPVYSSPHLRRYPHLP